MSGGNHPYLGINLEPDADLDSADLAYADLDFADLSEAELDSANLSFASLRYAKLSDADLDYADLRFANLYFADLSEADLDFANLSFASLRYANLSEADLDYADLTSANLAGARGLHRTDGPAFYDINTDFTGTGFDPVAAGWKLVPVPEPSTALLMGLGLAGLASRRGRPPRQTSRGASASLLLSAQSEVVRVEGGEPHAEGFRKGLVMG